MPDVVAAATFVYRSAFLRAAHDTKLINPPMPTRSPRARRLYWERRLSLRCQPARGRRRTLAISNTSARHDMPAETPALPAGTDHALTPYRAGLSP